ncbi:hypothetical protein EUGRSUZ_H02620 [Eucalyptus grandis]|uniref:Uncharacterized protein n=2 Tax=Eucalyptus grandis TaxID=71139 RepID=A0ACC3JTF0_EUCGR|nr:hypothetical protein EUGRSUZ_H02620 [Eucalyptus grandis]
MHLQVRLLGCMMHMKKIGNDKATKSPPAIKRQARKTFCETTYHKNVLLTKWQNIYLTVPKQVLQYSTYCHSAAVLSFFFFPIQSKNYNHDILQVCLSSTVNN